MRLSRRQLRRLIESAIYEQEVTKGMSTGEMEDAKQEKDEEVTKLAGAILGITIRYLSPDRSTDPVSDIFKILKGLSTNFKLPDPDRVEMLSDEERFKELEDKLAGLFDKSDRVITNKAGHLFMKRDLMAFLGVEDNPMGLGDYLKDKIGYSNLKKYPHIYALYQANA